MSLFSTKNSDGASGLGEPVNTIPAKADRQIKTQVQRHMAESAAELFSAGSRNVSEYDPKKADRN